MRSDWLGSERVGRKPKDIAPKTTIGLNNQLLRRRKKEAISGFLLWEWFWSPKPIFGNYDMHLIFGGAQYGNY